jgi:ribose transport system permease protein
VAFDSPLAPPNTSRLRLSLAKPNQEQIVLLITIVLLIGFGLTLHGFATLTNLLNLLRSISILGILGLGMGLIVISRGIDLSEVAIMAGSWAIGLIEIQKGLPIGWACLVALGLAISIGVVNGVMVAFVEAPALFVTLAAGSPSPSRLPGSSMPRRTRRP